MASDKYEDQDVDEKEDVDEDVNEDMDEEVAVLKGTFIYYCNMSKFK